MQTLDLEPESARDRLLLAGTRIIAGIDASALERWLTANDVSRAAGLSRRTFYDNFATVAEYVRTLTATLTEEAEKDGPPSVLDAAEGDVRSALTGLTEMERSDHELRKARLVLDLLSTPSPLAGNTSRSPWLRFVTSLIDVGQTPSEPLSPNDVAVALGAVSDAFELVPAGVLHDTVVDALIGVISTMTTGRGLDERPDSMLMERRIATAWREMTDVQPVLNIRRVVLQAAADEVAADGLAQLSLAVLHRRTGLSESAIGKYVGSVRDIASALLAEVYPTLAIALESDPNLQARPMAALHAHVCRMVEIVRERPDFAEIELMSRLNPPGRRYSVERTVASLDDLLLELFSRLSPNSTPTALQPLIGVVQQLSCTLGRETTAIDPSECGDMVLSMLAPRLL